MKIKPLRLAVVGCGVIADIYMENMLHRFSILEVAGCCDLNAEAARKMAEKYGVPVLSLQEIFADETIELVVNLTPPAAHYTVIRQALLAGKHVYTEKPLASTLEEGMELTALADEKHLELCSAPDTFLGAALQTARHALDGGLIGEVTSCVATLNRDGGWMAEKYPYTALPGGGIGLDVGIYYVTALLSLLGPVAEVCGFWDTLKPNRTHYSLSLERWNEPYRVESENLVSGAFRFASGAYGNLHLNANSTQNQAPQMILYGSQGLMYLPDPNLFGGDVQVLLKGQQQPLTLPYTNAYSENSRGLGVAEMSWALRLGRKPRANGKMALHGVELLLGIRESSQSKRMYAMRTTFERPAALPRGYLDQTYSNADPENGLAIS